VALTVPSLDRLARHLRADSVQEAGWDEDVAADELQQATDLMVLATSLVEDPTDEVGARLVVRGILSMAQALLVRGDDRDKEFSMFSSERIGSYSWTRAAANGEATGIEDFDRAVEWVNEAGGLNDVFISTERVFTDPGAHTEQEFDRYPYHLPRSPLERTTTRTSQP